MIITLSPAKVLDFESKIHSLHFSQPIFKEEALELNSILKQKTIEDIIDLMKVNPELAQNTLNYIYLFDQEKNDEKQAAFAYNGIAFRGLDIVSLSSDDLAFAQKNLIILSGLYGILRPLDMIRPYRLEMQAKLDNEKGKNLYDFWRDILSQEIAGRMKEDDNIWINLASNEYSKVIDRQQLPKSHRMIIPVFKESAGDVYKQVTVHAKKARGMMTRWIIQNKIEDIEHLKAFDTEGYVYSEQLSNKDEWVFIR